MKTISARDVTRMAVTALLLGLAACSSNSRSPSSGAATATSGSTAAAGPGMDEAQVLKDLRDHGYDNVSNLHRSGSDWRGSAVDNTGAPVQFDVDPQGLIAIVQ
jgi:hypothetical protein